MKFTKIFFLTAFALSLFSSQSSSSPQTAWEKISMGVLEAHFGSLTPVSVTPQIIFLDSRYRLYRTLDEGRHWSEVFKLPGGLESEIHRVFASPHHSETVYVASSEGLFLSRDLGAGFKLLFTSAQKKERNCLALYFHPLDPDILYLGTGDGLFWTLDGGETWFRESLDFSDQEIRKIEPDPVNQESLLVLTPNRLYSIEEKTGASKILYHVFGVQNNTEPEEEPADEDSEDTNEINDVAFSMGERHPLFLATGTGILESRDRGRSWSSFPMHGLKSQEINRVVVADSQRIFAATTSGVYQYLPQEKRWEELEEGLDRMDTRDLAFHPARGGLLYTVTSSGAFRRPVPSNFMPEATEFVPIEIDAENLSSMEKYLRQEPSIRALHEAAITYSDLHPQKILRWQRQSRLSHLLPKLSGSVSRDKSRNIDVDRGGTNQPDVFMMGPDEESLGWDASIGWDFAELVWSSDQTSINSRSKLMTELRNEILANLTRLYFERRRLISEYFLETPQDTLSRLDLVQRIEELTAHIDGFTGGFLSDQLEQKNMNLPWKNLKNQPAE